MTADVPGLRDGVPEVSEQAAQELSRKADELAAQAAALGAQSDLLRAQSEIVATVLQRQAMAREALAGLDQAREALAVAQSLYEPVAAELEQVQREIATLDPDRAGDLDSRLGVRQRIYALTDELGPLQQRVQERQRLVDDAREAVRSYEADQVPLAAAELDAATSALQNPPLDDFARLVELAPQTVQYMVMRNSTALVTPDRARWSDPHSRQVVASLMFHLQLSGVMDMLQEYWVSSLREKLDPKTHARVVAATTPQEQQHYDPPPAFRDGVPEPDPAALERARAAAQLGGPPQPEVLPAYGSAQAAALRQAERRAARFRGPQDWPAFNGIRTPFTGPA